MKRAVPDVVLCDVFLPDGNGVDFVVRLKKEFPMSEVILLTAHGNISDGVQAIKNGAFDYITKGDDNNRIIPLLSQASEKAAKNKSVNKEDRMDERQYSFAFRCGIFGQESKYDRCSGIVDRRDRNGKRSVCSSNT